MAGKIPGAKSTADKFPMPERGKRRMPIAFQFALADRRTPPTSPCRHKSRTARFATRLDTPWPHHNCRSAKLEFARENPGRLRCRELRGSKPDNANRRAQSHSNNGCMVEAADSS